MVEVLSDSLMLSDAEVLTLAEADVLVLEEPLILAEVLVLLDSLVLWLADKLANMRSLASMYSELGEEMWQKLGHQELLHQDLYL